MEIMFKFKFKFFAFLLLNLLYCDCHDISSTFVKTDHTFERTVQNETITLQNSQLKRIPDYIHTTQTLLDMILMDESSVKLEYLNKFNLGIHQFFLSLAYEVYYNRSVVNYPKLEFNDPVPLPNATAFGKPDLMFYGAQAYAFPGFKKGYQEMGRKKDDPYLQHYEIHRHFTSDVLIFTGYFNVYNNDFFFVYHTKNNTLKTTLLKWRSNEGTITTKKTKDILYFDEESLTHTYESSLKRFNIVNETLYTKLIAVVEQVWLPKLIANMYDELYPSSVQDNAEFALIYRQKVMQCLLQSSVQYIKMLNLTSFIVSPMNFTSTSNDQFVLMYQNIKLEGLSNFLNYELSDSKIEIENDTVIMSNTIKLLYSGEKENYISFTIGHGRKIFQKKYSLKNAIITTAFYARLNETPLKVYRKRDTFWNGSGFLILFELTDFDPALGFVVRHVGNEMARAVADLLENETDIFNVEFK